MRERRIDVTNGEIVDSFLEHQSATGPVSTDGKEIKSYGQTVARWEDGSIVMPGTSNYLDKGITRCRNLVRLRAISKGIRVTQT